MFSEKLLSDSQGKGQALKVIHRFVILICLKGARFIKQEHTRQDLDRLWQQANPKYE